MENNRLYRNGIPQFNGQNGQSYDMWRNEMQAFLGAQEYGVWQSVVIGYTSSKNSKTVINKELKRNNKIVMDFILEGLPDSVKDKMGQCSSAK
jgi:hypothetical protein